MGILDVLKMRHRTATFVLVDQVEAMRRNYCGSNIMKGSKIADATLMHAVDIRHFRKRRGCLQIFMALCHTSLCVERGHGRVFAGSSAVRPQKLGVWLIFLDFSMSSTPSSAIEYQEH